jgi:hypothetical protein
MLHASTFMQMHVTHVPIHPWLRLTCIWTSQYYLSTTGVVSLFISSLAFALCGVKLRTALRVGMREMLNLRYKNGLDGFYNNASSVI